MMEKQRLRYHFNLKEYQLCKFMREAFRTSRYLVVRCLQLCESRLDNVLWRLGCAPTMAAARYLIRGKHVQFRKGTQIDRGEAGWKTQSAAHVMCGIGDQIRIQPREASKAHVKKMLAEDGDVQIPEHLDWDPENLVCTYLNVCDPSDFGIEVEEKFIFMWYAGQGSFHQRSLRRTHVRYHPGTTKIIDKRHNGGAIPKTPENIINMKIGKGLRLKGITRPPCLWNRSKPLNNPYEVFKGKY